MVELDERLKLTRRIERRYYTVIALVVIAIVCILVAGFIVNAQQTAKRNRDIQINNCKIGNEFRTNNRQLWDYILALSPEKPPTPEQAKRIIDFKKFLNKTFELRDCNKI